MCYLQHSLHYELPDIEEAALLNKRTKVNFTVKVSTQGQTTGLVYHNHSMTICLRKNIIALTDMLEVKYIVGNSPNYTQNSKQVTPCKHKSCN